jgi:hypothetical protein
LLCGCEPGVDEAWWAALEKRPQPAKSGTIIVYHCVLNR